jgi:DNA-binding LacI/PurR family transcriptional regulator
VIKLQWVLLEARKNGIRLPEDIAIIGFDSIIRGIAFPTIQSLVRKGNDTKNTH